jgi:hypothetical protein
VLAWAAAGPGAEPVGQGLVAVAPGGVA